MRVIMSYLVLSEHFEHVFVFHFFHLAFNVFRGVFLRDWVVEHVLGFDILLSNFLVRLSNPLKLLLEPGILMDVPLPLIISRVLSPHGIPFIHIFHCLLLLLSCNYFTT